VKWIRAHAVVLAGLALIAGQLGWTAALLAHSYFRQDDFAELDRALREGFGWKYLMSVNAGHLTPVGQAIDWLLARISLYNWGLAAAVIMIGVAVASLAMLRMLITVFGNRPAILIPLAVYLFSPLSAGAFAWLDEARWVLPLQAAMFLAVAAHVRYLREQRRRDLILAGVWIVVGLAAADQGALVPVLLFALTAAYFEPGRLRDAVVRAAAGYWRAWALYGALLAGYCAVFFTQLAGSGVNVAGPGQATSLYEFVGAVLGINALPGLLGGPWQWQASGYAQAAPPSGLEYLSWVVVAVLVLVSCLFRVRAWRAWAILLGWILAADVLPAALGGFRLFARALGAETGYLADATGVIALCLALAFLPAGEASRESPRAVRVAAVAAFCCFAAGTIVSLQAFTSSVPDAARSYIATARAAIRHVPRGTLIVSGPTPDAVIDPGFFPGQADTAAVIGPLARRGAVSWTSELDGFPARPMTFDNTGHLRPAVVVGASGAPRACLDVTAGGVSIPLSSDLYQWSWTLRMSYTGPAGTLWVSIGAGGSQQVRLPAGSHVLYLPLTGSGNTLSVQFAGPRALCLRGATVGLVYAG
jgi:hypothetical protein